MLSFMSLLYYEVNMILPIQEMEPHRTATPPGHANPITLPTELTGATLKQLREIP